jgi:hypothetical protein
MHLPIVRGSPACKKGHGQGAVAGGRAGSLGAPSRTDGPAVRPYHDARIKGRALCWTAEPGAPRSTLLTSFGQPMIGGSVPTCFFAALWA